MRRAVGKAASALPTALRQNLFAEPVHGVSFAYTILPVQNPSNRTLGGAERLVRNARDTEFDGARGKI